AIPRLTSARGAELFNILSNLPSFISKFGISAIDPETSEIKEIHSSQNRAQLFTDLQLLWQQLNQPAWRNHLITQLSNQLIKIAFEQTAERIKNLPQNKRLLLWPIDFIVAPEFLAAINTILSKEAINLQISEGKTFLVKSSCIGPGKTMHGDNTCYLATFLSLAYESAYFQEALLAPSTIDIQAQTEQLHQIRDAIFPASTHKSDEFDFRSQNEIKPLETINFGALEPSRLISFFDTNERFLENFVYKHLLALKNKGIIALHPQKELLMRVIQGLKALREDPGGHIIPFEKEASLQILRQLINPLIPEFNYIQQILALGELNPRSISQFFRVTLQELALQATAQIPTIEAQIIAIQETPGFAKNPQLSQQLKTFTELLMNLKYLNSIKSENLPITFELLKNLKIVNSNIKIISESNPDLSPILITLNNYLQKLLIWDEVYQTPISGSLFIIYKSTCENIMTPKIKRYILALLKKLADGNTITVEEMNKLDDLFQRAKIFTHTDYNQQDWADILPFIQRLFSLEIPFEITQLNFMEFEKAQDLYNLIDRSLKEKPMPQLPKELLFRITPQLGSKGEKIYGLTDLKPYVDFGIYLTHKRPAYYELTKVMVNQAGHWLSYIKQNDAWYRLNDIAKEVVPVSFEEVQIEASLYAATVVFKACDLHLSSTAPSSGSGASSSATAASQAPRAILTEAKIQGIAIQSFRQRVYLGQILAIPETVPPQPLVPAFNFNDHKTVILENLVRIIQLQGVKGHEEELRNLEINLFNTLETEINKYYLPLLTSRLSIENLRVLKDLEEKVNKLHCDIIQILQFNNMNKLIKTRELIISSDPEKYKLLTNYLGIIDTYKEKSQGSNT
ncbi:MAG: hypothetical protein WC860_01925, partial [Candidatus Margulisiibacteriota bacterium]